jgi:hypothetical protein
MITTAIAITVRCTGEARTPLIARWLGFEERRGNQRRHDGAEDDNCHEDRVRRLIDIAVGQPVQRGDRAERQTRGHEERRVIRVAGGQTEGARRWPDADDLGSHFRGQKECNQAGSGGDRRE